MKTVIVDCNLLITNEMEEKGSLKYVVVLNNP